jgi:hypothetical protein
MLRLGFQRRPSAGVHQFRNRITDDVIGPVFHERALTGVNYGIFGKKRVACCCRRLVKIIELLTSTSGAKNGVVGRRPLLAFSKCGFNLRAELAIAHVLWIG